jgi:hypothetical protein
MSKTLWKTNPVSSHSVVVLLLHRYLVPRKYVCIFARISYLPTHPPALLHTARYSQYHRSPDICGRDGVEGYIDSLADLSGVEDGIVMGRVRVSDER